MVSTTPNTLPRRNSNSGVRLCEAMQLCRYEIVVHIRQKILERKNISKIEDTARTTIEADQVVYHATSEDDIGIPCKSDGF